MRVAILGAGSVALATAAFLVSRGHEPIIWSPRGGNSEALVGSGVRASGALSVSFVPAVVRSCEEAVASSDVVLIALPAYGHKVVMDAAAPYLRNGQVVIISSHASFGALYLSKLLAASQVDVTIVAWATTVTTGRKVNSHAVTVNTVRDKIDFATLPKSAAALGNEVCTGLFGDRFVLRDGILAIALSNLNPQGHLSIMLLNLTRAEIGETWSQPAMVTPTVGRLMEALDLERVAIASAFGVSVRSVFEHFMLSYQVARGSVSEMNQEMRRRGSGGDGPRSLDTRYITEDVPYGLVCTCLLGQIVNVPTPLHDAGINILEASLGKDFRSANDILPQLSLETLSQRDFLDLVTNGFSRV